MPSPVSISSIICIGIGISIGFSITIRISIGIGVNVSIGIGISIGIGLPLLDVCLKLMELTDRRANLCIGRLCLQKRSHVMLMIWLATHTKGRYFHNLFLPISSFLSTVNVSDVFLIKDWYRYEEDYGQLYRKTSLEDTRINPGSYSYLRNRTPSVDRWLCTIHHLEYYPIPTPGQVSPIHHPPHKKSV